MRFFYPSTALISSILMLSNCTKSNEKKQAVSEVQQDNHFLASQHTLPFIKPNSEQTLLKWMLHRHRQVAEQTKVPETKAATNDQTEGLKASLENQQTDLGGLLDISKLWAATQFPLEQDQSILYLPSRSTIFTLSTQDMNLQISDWILAISKDQKLEFINQRPCEIQVSLMSREGKLSQSSSLFKNGTAIETIIMKGAKPEDSLQSASSESKLLNVDCVWNIDFNHTPYFTFNYTAIIGQTKVTGKTDILTTVEKQSNHIVKYDPSTNTHWWLKFDLKHTNPSIPAPTLSQTKRGSKSKSSTNVYPFHYPIPVDFSDRAPDWRKTLPKTASANLNRALH